MSLLLQRQKHHYSAQESGQSECQGNQIKKIKVRIHKFPRDAVKKNYN